MKTKKPFRTNSIFTAIVIASAAGCAAPASSDHTASEEVVSVGEALIGDHLSGISDADFSDAEASFKAVEDIDDGLGPIFNERACGNCHSQGAVGGAGAQIERRFGRFDSNKFNPLAN